MDLRKVKKLIELFEESTLSEMEISESDATVRMSRGQTARPAVNPPVIDSPVIDSNNPVEAAGNAPPPASQQAGTSIDSPMVGTFYTASSPDAEPYVSVGTKVSTGDVLCVIEAMKTFNQLQCEVSGTVTAILKSSGDPVEYGEPLFLIDGSD